MKRMKQKSEEDYVEIAFEASLFSKFWNEIFQILESAHFTLAPFSQISKFFQLRLSLSRLNS